MFYIYECECIANDSIWNWLPYKNKSRLWIIKHGNFRFYMCWKLFSVLFFRRWEAFNRVSDKFEIINNCYLAFGIHHVLFCYVLNEENTKWREEKKTEARIMNMWWASLSQLITTKCWIDLIDAKLNGRENKNDRVRKRETK